MDKFVTSGALKKTIDLTKDNLTEHDTRLQNIENATPTELQCENTITTIPANVQNNLKLTSVQGKTLQNHVPIPYSFERITNDTVSVSDDNYITIIGNGGTNNAMLDIMPTVKPSTLYTFVLDIKANTLTGDTKVAPLFYITSNGDYHQFPIGKGFTNETGTHIFTLTTSSDPSIWINGISSFVYTNTTGGSITYRLMILEGDWTNKEIPEYFEGIQSVQNPLELQFTHKNLIIKDTFTENKSLHPYNGNLTSDSTKSASDFMKVVPNEYYTRSTDGVLNGSGITSFIYWYDSNKVFIKYTDKLPALSPANACYARIAINKNDMHLNHQMECGKIPTAYEPYIQPTVNKFQFEGELRSLPNGVCDEIKDGKLIKRVGKIVLNGSESNWGVTQVTENGNYDFRLDLVAEGFPTKPRILESIDICDTMPTYEPNTLGSKKMVGLAIYPHSNTSGQVILIRNDITTVNDLKTWLVNNPTTIYYELATPEIIDLDLQYNNPIYRAYANGNIIQNNVPIHPTLTFEYQTGLQGAINDLEKSNADQSKIISDLCGVVDFITLQIGDIAGILDYINGKDV